MQLSFLGAARQVTGSRSLLEANGQRIMIDCGLFQERAFLDRNWDMPLMPSGGVDTLLLTHAHLDHCGLIPRLVAGGFKGRIIATEPSRELAKLIMFDSAKIQKEDAEYKRRRHRKEGRQGKHPEKPLYTTADARLAAKRFVGVRYGTPVDLGDGLGVTFHEAGHILGSAMLEIVVKDAGDGSEQRIVFSGDLGQWDKPLIGDPTLLPRADYVVMESTYGDRNHRDAGDVRDQLDRVINDTVERGGNVVVPTFAVERAQDLIFHLGRLAHENRIPRIPVFLDSPMAVDVTEIFRRYRRYLDDETRALFDAGEPPLRFPGLRLVRSARDSKAINNVRGSSVILSTSGMCTAGRIKHHLRQNIGRPESTIVFVGYQPPGTLGRHIIQGDDEVRIHGRWHHVRADVSQIHGFSAHGDQEDLLRWVGHFDPKPKRVFLNHGEGDVADKLAKKIRVGGIDVTVPKYGETVELA